MKKETRIVNVDSTNVDEYGFFCYKSKRKTEGYKRKLNWLRQRFAEGMRMKILTPKESEGTERSMGFIEYIPGEFAWRTVNADEYMVIHCIWLVGRSKGKGYGTLLLDTCIQEWWKAGKKGVVIVTSSGSWLAGRKLFLRNSFKSVDVAPPIFELVVEQFQEVAPSSFPKNWDERMRRLGSGLTVLRADQCPYIDASVKAILQTSEELGIQTQVVEFTDSQELRRNSPSPYGVFNTVYDGSLLTYHSIGSKDLRKLLDNLVDG